MSAASKTADRGAAAEEAVAVAVADADEHADGDVAPDAQSGASTDGNGISADAGNGEKGAAPSLPDGLERRVDDGSVTLVIDADLKLAEAEAVREALVSLIAAEAGAGRTATVEAGPEPIGVPALQLAEAGRRHAAGVLAPPKSKGTRKNATAQRRSGRKQR